MTDSDEVKLLPTLDQLSDEEYAEAFRLFWTCPGDWTIAKLREEIATRPPVVTDEVVERVKASLLAPEALVAAAMQIEPELGCWKDRANVEAWEWRRGQEIKHAERIIRAAIASMPAVVSGGQE